MVGEAMVPVGRVQALGIASAAAAVRAATDFRAAVDERVSLWGSSDAGLKAAALALMSDAAVQAQLAFAKGNSSSGMNIDNVADGRWVVPSSSVAQSLTGGKPPGSAQQAAVLDSFSGSGNRLQVWRTTPNASARSRSWMRHRDTSGVWSAWYPEAPYDVVALTNGQDVRTLTPGIYTAASTAIAASLLNGPGVASPAVVEMSGDGANRKLTWTTTPAATSLSQSWVAFSDNGGSWSPWRPVDNNGVGLLATDDVNTLNPGTYHVRLSSVASAVLNGPGIATPGVLEIVTAGIVRIARWITTPNASVRSRVFLKHRDGNGTWSAWEEQPNEPLGGAGQAADVGVRTAQLVMRAIMSGATFPLETWRWSAPVGTRLTIPTHDGSGQAVHPSVLYYPGKKYGYEYWMAITPYPFSNDAHEDPNLLVSTDGTNWIVPPGVANPLDDAPGSPVLHNSDVNLVEGHTGDLVLTWRAVDRQDGDRNIFYMRRSSDGVTWSPKREFYRASIGAGFVAQSLVKNGAGWRMYGINGSRQFLYFETTVPNPETADWSGPTIFTPTPTPPSDRRWWHSDIQKVGSQWWGIVADSAVGVADGRGDLFLMRSTDGIAWEVSPVPITSRVTDAMDAAYKTGFVVSGTGTAATLDLFISGKRESTNEWSVWRARATAL